MTEAQKKRIRAIMSWTVPPRIEAKLVQTFGRFLMRGNARNAELKNRHAGQARCFVIGNGPSLQSHDLSILRDEVTIVANSFYKHPQCAAVAPNYLCIGDPRFMEDLENNVGWLREIEKALPDTVMFVRSEGSTLFRKHGLFARHQVYCRNPGYPARQVEDVELDLTRPSNVGQSTASVFSIPLAIYLGFRKIYLIGCDANWLEDPFKGAGHFYQTNAYHPQYDGGVANPDELEVEIRDVLRDFESHRLLRDRARPLGIEIINAGRGGWLNMYPRASFESLFA